MVYWIIILTHVGHGDHFWSAHLYFYKQLKQKSDVSCLWSKLVQSNFFYFCCNVEAQYNKVRTKKTRRVAFFVHPNWLLLFSDMRFICNKCDVSHEKYLSEEISWCIDVFLFPPPFPYDTPQTYLMSSLHSHKPSAYLSLLC